MSRRFRLTFKAIGIFVAVLVAGAQAIRPARTNPPIDPRRSIDAFVPITADARAILDRGCADCHSNNTTWPWYSNVAPVSWFVIDHVNHGRSHLNLSDWARVPPNDADRMLGQICDLPSRGEMPIGSYLLMHGDATLSPDDVRTLCDWTRTARRHLSQRPPAVTRSR